MTECKHGLRQGCFYCHNKTTTTPTSLATPKKRTKATRLWEQMNQRMTDLKKRLKTIRGE